MSCSVGILQGLEAMRALAPAWDELAHAAIEPNPFYEPWMLLPALECLGRGDEALLAVWAEGELGLVLPVRREPLFKAIGARKLAGWRNAHYLACTPLLRGGTAGRRCLAALLDWLADDRGGAEALELRYLGSGGPFHAALVEAIKARDLPTLAFEAYTRPILRRGADAQSYLAAALSKNSRRLLERKERELRARGRLEYRLMGPHDDAARWAADFLQLEASGWKGAAGTAMACSEANRRFASRTIEEAFARGRLMMSGLDFDGRPIARLWCFLAGRGSYGFKICYDERFKASMPGFLAEAHNIRNLHARTDLDWMDSYAAEGATVLDRLWKDRLAMQSLVVATRPAGEMALAAWSLLRWAKQQGRRALSAASRARARPAPARPQPASAP